MSVLLLLGNGIASASDGVIWLGMAWCIVEGSPAHTDPNIMDLSGGLDTTTADVIWRRHERPTGALLQRRAGISLRSGVHFGGDIFEFPFIRDMDEMRGMPGDVSGHNLEDDPEEFMNLIEACDARYPTANGITAVNINLFHNISDPWDYVQFTGWGGCYKDPPDFEVCSVPYDGRIMVVDNRYLYPTVPEEDRLIPSSDAYPLMDRVFGTKDDVDGLVAHETGHALRLVHRAETNLLMHGRQLDFDGDGILDNKDLTDPEVVLMRDIGMIIPGAEVDPPQVFVPSNFVATRLVDSQPDDQLPGYTDLSTVKFTLDQDAGRVYFGINVKGRIPCDPGQSPPNFVFLVDSDNNPQTGAGKPQLEELGIDSNFPGADLVAVAQPVSQSPSPGDCSEILGQAYTVKGDQVLALDPKVASFKISTLQMHPLFNAFAGSNTPFVDFVANVAQKVVFAFSNAALSTPVVLDQPFRAQAIVTEGGTPVDWLDVTEEGRVFTLKIPVFPHCFLEGDARPGDVAAVSYDNLLPNKEIHALLGPHLVVESDMTDENGAGVIQVPIPPDTTEGLHLLTIGHPALALTADCAVEVGAFDRCDLDQDDDVDRKDILIILAGLREKPQPGDPRDIDGDGRITIRDARQCVLRCTKKGCRP